MECEKCDLYKCEDEEVVIRRAAESAEREWRQKEGIEITWRWESKEKAAGYRERSSDGEEQGWVWRFIGVRRALTWLEILDWIINQLFD